MGAEETTGGGGGGGGGLLVSAYFSLQLSLDAQ